MAKTNTAIERVYNVPLRKEFRKVARYKKTKKAMTALRQFLAKHMKSDNIKISNDINMIVWKDGIKNPPHHIKVIAKKDDKDVVTVELFDKKQEKVAKKETKTPVKEEKATKEAPKPTVETKKE
jgi:large subunit ribosomal protein L31e